MTLKIYQIYILYNSACVRRSNFFSFELLKWFMFFSYDGDELVWLEYKNRIYNSIHLHLWYKFEQLTTKTLCWKNKKHITTDNIKHFTHLLKKKSSSRMRIRVIMGTFTFKDKAIFHWIKVYIIFCWKNQRRLDGISFLIIS